MIGAIQDLDPATMRKRIFTRNRKAEARSLDPAVDRRGALVERIEDPLALLPVDSGAAVDDIQHGKAAFSAERDHDRRRSGRVLDRVRHEIVDDGAQLDGVAYHHGRLQLLLERHHSRQRRELVLAQHAPHQLEHGNGSRRLGLQRARLVVIEQVLDQLLQRQRVLAHDADNLALFRRQLAAHVVAQQFRAFAYRGQRRLELVRHVPQEPVLLLLEIVQPRTQPFEALPEITQVLRPVDLDRVPEVGGAHPADRLIELPDRTGDQHGEEYREREGDGRGGERQVQPLLPSLRRDLLQALDGALGQPVRGGEHLRARSARRA